MTGQNDDTRRSPREALIAKDLVGFEISGIDQDVAAVKIATAKNGKPVPG